MHELTKIAKRIGHTDKVGSHCYTEFYGPFLNPRRESVKRLLEIGISEGGSIAMWAEFFPNAEIYGVDIDQSKVALNGELDDNPRVHLFFEDAYKPKFINKLKGLKFDIIIDDGLHSVPAWMWFLKRYPKLLADDGILMIEDIYSPEHAQHLIDNFKGDKDRLSIIDRRTIPGAYRHVVDFTFDDGRKKSEFITNEIVLIYM
jgi:spermidine synthase